MKHLLHLSALTLGLLFTACSSNAQQPTTSTSSAVATRIDVIEFHSEHRCETCINIEAMAREVLNTGFATQMRDGTITFRLVNVEEKANAKMAEEFGAYGTALFLDVHKNGTDEKVDLTEWAFMKANDAVAFKAELTQKLRSKR
ncbi:MAG: hypothetical protein IPO60_08460 [Flavobacteriales bacterium]|jgi:hypothetical protein|nr:hypothetical protein [Flavobacteriales bacterium]MBK6894038.1 hypothetical protein [Flavobacteriales bacterium]MBK7247983.1 hypothetical protein [Flavobacteriales bacterium]MBK7287668.1 hypothetical protein [Flavobacteriales bacterium]MBK9598340.1 hypothetical protein [Flavobacteriales bacterium]